MAYLEKKTKRYPTDLTDEEWERIKSFLPSAARKGRKPSVDFREVLNAVRYIARAGCGWRRWKCPQRTQMVPTLRMLRF